MAGFWPWIIAYVVDWHNSTIGSAGSSTADALISPHQRFNLRPPRVMDLATFGCRAVVLKPPTHQAKTSLAPRGWIGTFLGRSRHSKDAYDVLVGRTVVTSSSVNVDEENFDRTGRPAAAAIIHSPPSPAPPLSRLTPRSAPSSCRRAPSPPRRRPTRASSASSTSSRDRTPARTGSRRQREPPVGSTSRWSTTTAMMAADGNTTSSTTRCSPRCWPRRARAATTRSTPASHALRARSP